jgi:LDH2 family malate/lactate/ureidoglycolate dehydrogenase
LAQAIDVRFATETKLATFASRALVRLGVPNDAADTVAAALISADLRGIPEHGVARLVPAYVERLRNGTIEAVPVVTVLRETPTSIVFDAANGLGPPVAERAMRSVIEKARTGGVAFGAVRNANDFGIAGFYAMLALEHDMIGIAATNANRAVAPTFGTEKLVGSNPWAYAVPTAEEPAFVLDFATSQAESPGRVLEGALLPLGGLGTDNGGHKGYGLGVLVDVMCAVLAGGTFGRGLPQAGSDDVVARTLSHFFGAIRVDGFRDVAEFKADMDRELRAFKDAEKAPGFERIYVAGEIEHERTLAARKRGVPIEPGAWASLETLATELGLPFDIAVA